MCARKNYHECKKGANYGDTRRSSFHRADKLYDANLKINQQLVARKLLLLRGR
jgi:hypothetical protein